MIYELFVSAQKIECTNWFSVMTCREVNYDSFFSFQSPVITKTPTMYLDFKLAKGATIDQPVPEGWNGFVYVLSGTALFGRKYFFIIFT